MQGMRTVLMMLLAAALLLTGQIVADAKRVLYVPGDYATIQEAIDAANDHEVVLVASGTYEENISFKGKNVTVISAQGADSTTIEAANVDSAVVYFTTGEPKGATLSGFTITGSHASGIYCSGSSPTIVECLITHNRSNTSNNGGGLDLNYTTGAVIKDNVFDADTASTYGSAIHAEYGENDTICYNVIRLCRGYGEIRTLTTKAAIYNNTIDVAGSYYSGITAQNNDTLDCRNNIIMNAPSYGMRAANGAYIKPQYNLIHNSGTAALSGNIIGSIGNVTTDPLLTDDDRPYRTSPVSLRQPSYDVSDAIDGGDTAAFFNDPDGTRNDIGAHPVCQVGDNTMYSHIQDAIDDVGDGDVVLVRPGTYTGSFTLEGKRLIVSTLFGPDSTIIEANEDSDSAVVYMVSEEPKGTELSYFYITGGEQSGVYVDGASPNILFNEFDGNASSEENTGGGLDLNNTEGALIRGNILRFNEADTYGSGMHVEYSTNDTICYNLLYWNKGYVDIRCLSSNAFIFNNTIDSDSGSAHGISNQNGSDTVRCVNNIVYKAAMYGCYAADGGYMTVSFSDNYNCGSGATGGGGLILGLGNFSYSPGFWWSPAGEPEQYDITPLSWCVDEGDSASFFDDPCGYPRSDIGWKASCLNEAKKHIEHTTRNDSREVDEGDQRAEDVPSFGLRQNAPNPFNPVTTISFSLPGVTDVRLDVYNVLGQRVATLVDERMEAGEHMVTWDGTGVASGLYLYRLQAGEFTASRKMLLLK